MSTLVLDDDDALSQQLIAKLLWEERAFAAAEELQFALALEDSAIDGDDVRSCYDNTPGGETDTEMALRLAAQESLAVFDAVIAQESYTREAVANVNDKQYAIRIAAAERRNTLDFEFAKALQKADEEGGVNDADARVNDVETFLGKAVIEKILSASQAEDPNAKGKGKAKDPWLSSDQHTPVFGGFSSDLPTCGICLEPFRSTANPGLVAKGPSPSSQLEFGLRLPCPKSHGYCLSCLRSFILSKLTEGKHGATVFPIRCPECPIGSWEMYDTIAEKVLNGQEMVQWHDQKLDDSLPKFYCPNTRCSMRLEIDEEDEDMEDSLANCPACLSQICIPCKTMWHSGLSCEEYQSLPVSERSPDDQLTLQLAKSKHWRRCPTCKVIVQLELGCNHITCRCKTHFCYKCGSLWDKVNSRCTKSPNCELWDEEMLLLTQEQGGAGMGARVVQRPAPPPVRGGGGGRRPARFEWMSHHDRINTLHPFTRRAVESLTCGYCGYQANSMETFIYHLEHTPHAVYACCGRLFRRIQDFERHETSRLPYHNDTVAPGR